MKLRFKYTLPVLAAALSVNAARAQFNVKGNVALDNGDKAIGATLRLLRSGEVATTDADGNFTLHSSHATDRLVAAYIGFRSDTIDVTAANANALAIVLREEVQQVSEVVVKGRVANTLKSRIATVQTEKINYEELTRAACCNLSESFETNASVDVSYSDAATGAKQIRLLGLPGTYVQMLTENVPNFRGAASLFGLDYVPAPWMESIQVSKGSASVRNGYESVTGQINVEYKKPMKAAPLTLNLFASDAGRMEGNADAAIRLSKHLSTGLFAHYSRDKQSHDADGDGFLDLPLTEQFNVFNRWFYNRKNYVSQVGVKLIHETRENGQTAHATPARPGDPLYRIDIRTLRGEVFTKNGYVLDEEANRSVALILAGSFHKQDAPHGALPYDLRQSNVYANLLFDTDLGVKHKISTGLSLNMDRTEQTSNYFADDPAFLRLRTEWTAGAFAEYTWKPMRNLDIMAGLRADRHNEYGAFVTPRLHLHYTPIEALSVRASVGKGYRSVNVFVENNFLFASNRVRNLSVAPDLRMESAWNWGASLTGYLPIAGQELTLSAEYYQTDFQNQVVADVMTDAHGVRFYNLDGRAYARNIQLEAAYTFFKALDVRAAWRWTDAKETYNGRLMEKPLTNRYKGLLTVGYRTPRYGWQLDATAQFNGAGSMPTPDAARPLWEPTFDPYTMLGAQVTKRFKKMSVYLGAENLLNFKQAHPIVASSDPWGNDFDATMVWGPVHGRKIYAGLRWSL